MFARLLYKLLIGACFALPFGVLAAATAQAKEPSQAGWKNDCVDCHEVIQSHWNDSPHAQSMTNPVFLAAWEAQGNPDNCLTCHTTEFDATTGEYEIDSVSCVVCHTPAAVNHPEDIMPTNFSSRMCGDCHLDTFAEWESSVHAQEDLSCARCHSSHSTDLRVDGVQELCQSCHEEEAHFFMNTAHAEEGLMCADCHLSVADTQMGDGHGQRHHTFTVDMDACYSCHSDSTHYPAIAAASMNREAEETPAMETEAAVETAGLATIPEPISPTGFAIVAALIGMGVGIVMAPWLESWYRRIR